MAGPIWCGVALGLKINQILASMRQKLELCRRSLCVVCSPFIAKRDAWCLAALQSIFPRSSGIELSSLAQSTRFAIRENSKACVACLLVGAGVVLCSCSDIAWLLRREHAVAKHASRPASLQDSLAPALVLARLA